MSNKTISKAQLEVWAWKQSLHEEIKDMPLKEGIRFLLKKGSDFRKALEKEEKLSAHHPQKKS